VVAARPEAPLRKATAADVHFLDYLQERHAHEVGYLPRRALEYYCEKGQVWLALENGAPAGYLLGQDRYYKRSDVGIIFQACIQYDARRRLLGTLLVEAYIASLPPGVKQVCLWCARDIEANLFWQSMGFTPAAVRAGSRSKGRVHVFWARRVGTPSAQVDASECAPSLWVPGETRGGLMRELRPVRVLAPGDDWEHVTPPPPAQPRSAAVTPASTVAPDAERAPAPSAGPALQRIVATGSPWLLPPGMIRIAVGGCLRLVPRPPNPK